MLYWVSFRDTRFPVSEKLEATNELRYIYYLVTRDILEELVFFSSIMTVKSLCVTWIGNWIMSGVKHAVPL